MKTSKVIGQRLLKKQLDFAFSSDQVPHAQLFTGLSGYGTLPLAIDFGLQLLGTTKHTDDKSFSSKIQHPDFHFVYPIVKRGSEKVVFAQDYVQEWNAFLESYPYGNYTDWFDFIDVGNKQGLISVSEIEKLHQKMYLKAFGGGNKVCIMWGVEKMNVSAANSFLKLLEEPPSNTYFILIAEDGELLLPTLRSRCQQISLGPISATDLIEEIPSDISNKTELIAQSSGDYRRLSHLLNNTQKKNHEALLIKGLRTAFKAKGNKAVVIDLMDWSTQVSTLGREGQKDFLEYGIQFFRDAFLLNYSLSHLVHFHSENNFDLNKLAPFVHSENIQELIGLFESSYYHILRNASAKMIFSNLGIQLTRIINKTRG
jgi:DNA polymerase-3 subunit delta'